MKQALRQVSVDLGRADQLLNLHVLVRLVSYSRCSRTADDHGDIEAWSQACSVRTIGYAPDLGLRPKDGLHRLHHRLDQWVGPLRLQRSLVVLDLYLDPQVGMISIGLATVWQGLPFFMMMFVGAMMTVPPELYEAAAIDGASAWARLRFITVPSILDVIAVTVMLSLIWTFNSFNTVFILTNGGPANRTQILPTLSYQYGLQRGALGQGAAVMVSVLPLFIGLIFLLTRRMLRDKGVR